MAWLRTVEIGSVVLGVLVVGATGYAWGRNAPAPVVQVVAPPPISLEHDCSTPGVRVTLDGEDAFAPAVSTNAAASRKYRRGGERMPWLTVHDGPLDVHATGGFMTSDVGATHLTIFTLRVKGEDRGYTLARDGRSVLVVSSVDDAFVRGHFEADVSKVDDTTRTPAFGTPVVRVRGTFCLPAKYADPRDTAP
ncbi:MAG: hypothetical protein KIT84_30240 [Labilithrix sp.]|nr:hypothetical protein [Labilithrix sp.]MCW5815345.1 hypothetical protein [Labilithrix sp.]